MRKVKLVLQILAAFIIAQLAFWGLYEPNSDAVKAILDKPSAVSAEQSNVPPSGSLKITVLDVEHGDAILLQDDKRNIMVDVGDSKNRQLLEQKLSKYGVNRIKSVIVSHHHKDHMGNIFTVAGRYGVSNIYDNGNVNNGNKNSIKLHNILSKGEYNNRVLKSGDVVQIDKGYYFEVLSPGEFLQADKRIKNDQNNNSVVLKLHYGDFTMLLTGDIEAPAEALLYKKYGSSLKSDVLKVGHHGSKTSSYYKFIEQVKPQYALISCGDFVKYHHPNKNVVGSLEHLGAKVYTTEKNGDLTIVTDGKGFTFTNEK
mgnify:FL=1